MRLGFGQLLGPFPGLRFFSLPSLSRFVQYKATSLEKQHKHDLLTEPDLGVTIDLINPDTYRIDPNGETDSVHPSQWWVNNVSAGGCWLGRCACFVCEENLHYRFLVPTKQIKRQYN